MHKFYKFLIGLIPIKKVRKKLRFIFNCSEQSNEFRIVYYALKAKRDALLNDKKNIKTIFLGSSHVDYAFNPEYYNKSSFNLGGNSQDLCNANLLYKFFNKELSNLENVIIGISVFSTGYDLSKTSRNFICDIMHFLYGFTYENYIYNKNNLSFCKILDRETKQLNKQYNGFVYPPSIAVSSISLADRTSAHLRENSRKPNQLHFLEKIIEDIKINGHNLTLVFMPAHPEYIKNLPHSDELFGKVKEFAKNNKINMIDFYNDALFDANCFYDFDHLNIQGSEIFTKKLKEYI